MQKYLNNLALIHLNNYCKEKKVDYSGSHLYKYSRKQMFALIRTKTNKSIATVFFYTNQTPLYSIFPNN